VIERGRNSEESHRGHDGHTRRHGSLDLMLSRLKSCCRRRRAVGANRRPGSPLFRFIPRS
jgi:hypothetical protein